VGCGLLWIPFMKLISGQLYQYLQSVQAYISPPIASVFLVGLFWKRVNARGAMAALLSGFVVGMARLVAELNKGALSGPLYTFADINFLHFALFLFLFCTAVLILVSYTAPAPSLAQVAGLTRQTLHDAPAGSGGIPSDPAWRRKDMAFSGLLILLVGLIWLYFTG
jgi:SSS family solute:Na+ symporter